MGDWKRAVTQLKLSAELDPMALPMAQTYREAIICEVFREKVFAGEKGAADLRRAAAMGGRPDRGAQGAGGGQPETGAEMRAKAFDAAPATPGTADGQRFDWIADADMRLGPVLEIIVNGRYFWMPFNAIRCSRSTRPPICAMRSGPPATIKLRNGGECVALIPTRYAGTATDPGHAPAPVARHRLGRRGI